MWRIIQAHFCQPNWSIKVKKLLDVHLRGVRWAGDFSQCLCQERGFELGPTNRTSHRRRDPCGRSFACGSINFGRIRALSIGRRICGKPSFDATWLQWAPIWMVSNFEQAGMWARWAGSLHKRPNGLAYLRSVAEIDRYSSVKGYWIFNFNLYFPYQIIYSSPFLTNKHHIMINNNNNNNKRPKRVLVPNFLSAGEEKLSVRQSMHINMSYGPGNVPPPMNRRYKIFFDKYNPPYNLIVEIFFNDVAPRDVLLSV